MQRGAGEPSVDEREIIRSNVTSLHRTSGVEMSRVNGPGAGAPLGKTKVASTDFWNGKWHQHHGVMMELI
jgi:hypothetical protein